MIVIGIDPGTGLTGYGIIQEQASGTLQTLAYGVIQTPPKSPLPDRLVTIYRELTQIIELHRPDTAAVENLYFQRNVRTAMSVGQARGVVLLALAQAGLQIGEYTPLEIKQQVAGYGGAEKRQMQLVVQMQLHLQELPRPDDAADALAVAICHLYKSRLARIIQDQS